MASIEYKKREFCKAIECKIQAQIDKGNMTKDFCVTHCIKTAWEFHDWLQKNGFSLMKESVLNDRYRLLLTFVQHFAFAVSKCECSPKSAIKVLIDTLQEEGYLDEEIKGIVKGLKENYQKHGLA